MILALVVKRLRADYIWPSNTPDEAFAETLMRSVESPLLGNKWRPPVTTDFVILDLLEKGGE